MNAVDTNVLLYCCDQRDTEKQATALNLVASLRDTIIPWQVACEFIASSRKLAAYGLTAENAWERLSEFLHLFPLAVPRLVARTRQSAPRRLAAFVLGRHRHRVVHGSGRHPLVFRRRARRTSARL